MELSFLTWPATPPKTPSQPRIALLHGMGGTAALWRPVAASLENHYSLMAFDQRGHGKSRIAQPAGGRESSSGGYTPLDFGQDVIETLAAQNIHPTWLIGHSMGVRTACAAAHLKPEWIQGLILVDLGFSGPVGGGLGEPLAQFVRKLPVSFESREEARQFMNEHCPDRSIAQYLMAVSVRDGDGRLSFPFDHGALIETIQGAKDVSVRSWVRELGARGMPILMIRGAESQVWTRAEFEEEKRLLADLPSITFLEIEGAGHGLPFEQRLRFVAEVEGFIGKNSAPKHYPCKG
ncbi:alpha/beta hydrolase [Bdellovibrionota bacterium FG-1]